MDIAMLHLDFSLATDCGREIAENTPRKRGR
jgi:hypothetical protein